MSDECAESESTINRLKKEVELLRPIAEAANNPESRCPNCPDQGWYGVQTGGVDPDGENDTRESHQEQCQWCYETPNSLFNRLAAYAAFQAKREGK